MQTDNTPGLNLLVRTTKLLKSPHRLALVAESSNSFGGEAVSDLWQFFLRGLQHPNINVRRQFTESVSTAKRAVEENADDKMITAALLCFPCHMLASGLYIREPWNSDWLIESGTYDWLLELFGETVAEVVRLQPHCRRYIASINRSFADGLTPDQQEQFLREGGEMSLDSKFAFAKLKYFSQAMQLSRWIHQCGVPQNNLPELTTPLIHGSTLPCTASSVN